MKKIKLTPEMKRAAKPMPPFIYELRELNRCDLKTQTRRMHGLEEVNKEPNEFHVNIPNPNAEGKVLFIRNNPRGKDSIICVKCNYGKVGEIRYMREPLQCGVCPIAEYADDGKAVMHKKKTVEWRWKNSGLSQLHLPKIYARTFFQIVEVRAERLQEISNSDCVREGISEKVKNPKEHYRKLWTMINGATSWKKSPFVWVVTYKRIK